MNWSSIFSLSLWILPHALLGVLTVFLYKRRLYREFPCFFVYVCYELAEFFFLFALRSAPSVTDEQYRYAYYATLALSVVLRFGVIEEVSRDLFREVSTLKVTGRRSLRVVQGLLLATGVLLAIYSPGNSTVRLIAGVSVLNRGLAMVQSGLLLFLLFFCGFLGLSWRRPVFGIALGLGLIASADLAIFAIRTEFNSSLWVPYLDHVRTGTYLICVSVWIGYVLAPEPKPAPYKVISDEELKTWNKEFQHLLRP
jgi:hypothetical protein